VRRILLGVLLISALASTAALAALPEVILGPGLNSGRTEYFQNFDRTLSPDTAYVLTGLYYVDSTHTMTIPAGTVNDRAVLNNDNGHQKPPFNRLARFKV